MPPERFPRWIASFAERHQAAVAGTEGLASARTEALAVEIAAAHVTFTAPDGAVAACHPPFPGSLPPLAVGHPDASRAGKSAAAAELSGAAGETGVTASEIAAALSAHAMTPRTVGVLLVRLGGYAAGVFTGYPPALADAKTGSRPVHGRSAAGGWSQQRFARRREKQANEALQAAADAAVTVFSRWSRPQEITARSRTAAAARGREPGSAGLTALVLGGDKRAVAALRDDPRLAAYFAIASDRFLTVPDPKRAVLQATPRLFLAVRVRLTEPGAHPG